MRKGPKDPYLHSLVCTEKLLNIEVKKIWKKFGKNFFWFNFFFLGLAVLVFLVLVHRGSLRGSFLQSPCFLLKRMIFFHLLSWRLIYLYVTKNMFFVGMYLQQKFDFFNHIIAKKVNLKVWLLVKSGYHIVPNPSIVLFKMYLLCSLKILFRNFRQSLFHLSKPIIKHGQPCLHMWPQLRRKKKATTFQAGKFYV